MSRGCNFFMFSDLSIEPIYLFAAPLGYGLGSIPFGILLTGSAGLGDIRKQGSGNIGATNVLRTGRKDLALATLLLDGLKAAAALLIATYFWGEIAGLIAGGFAFLGHCFPIWLKFNGGKGVATYAGLLFAANIPIAIAAATCWLMLAYVYRYSSLAALITGIIVPVAAFGLNQPQLGFLFGLILPILFWRHRTNISRLFREEEPMIGKTSKSGASHLAAQPPISS